MIGNDVARGLDQDAEKGHDDSATLFILLTRYAAAVKSYCMRTGKVGPQKGARASLETLVAVSVPRSRNKRCLCVCRPTRRVCVCRPARLGRKILSRFLLKGARGHAHSVCEATEAPRSSIVCTTSLGWHLQGYERSSQLGT